MAIYKNKDIKIKITAKHVNLGNTGAQFYSDDENSASICFYIEHNNEPINLVDTGITPILSLFMKDGSIFINEPVDISTENQGQFEYKIRENVIKHVGIVRATLRLKNETQLIHAADFSFTILSSGIDERIAREINIDLIGDKIEQVLIANKAMFKGEKGDKGDKGEQGIQGEHGLQGIQGIQGIKGDTGERGATGDKGDKGDKGESVLASPKIYTRDEYNQLPTKDNNTLYFISEV